MEETGCIYLKIYISRQPVTTASIRVINGTPNSVPRLQRFRLFFAIRICSLGRLLSHYRLEWRRLERYGNIQKRMVHEVTEPFGTRSLKAAKSSCEKRQIKSPHMYNSAHVLFAIVVHIVTLLFIRRGGMSDHLPKDIQLPLDAQAFLMRSTTG